MRKIILTIVIGITGVMVLAQQPVQEPSSAPRSFSLREAMEHAVLHNLNAENARLDVESADQRVWEATATGLPQVSASVNYNNNLSLATTLIPDFLGDPSQKIEVQFGTKHFATAGMVANQVIFSGSFIVGLQTARIFREFTQTNRELTEQQVKESVAQGYYIVLLSENTLESLKGNLENMQSTLEDTRELFAAGFIEEIEVDQLEVTFTDLENAVSSMERQLVASRNLLKYQMGLDLGEEILLTDRLEDLVEDLNYQALGTSEMNVESNLDYQILRDREQLAYMDMKLKQTEYMPNLSAFFTMDFTAQRDEFNLLDTEEDWYQASAVGLSLNIPLFSSGLRMAGVAQKRIAYEQAKNTWEFAARGLKIEFMQAQYDLANAYEKYNREKKNLKLAQKVVNTTETKYNEGLAGSLELTQVNDQFLQTLSNYTSAMVEVLNAKVTLDRLMNKI
jgi:outer membrane protein TolC